ncbi:MAG: family helicase [Paenibacillaceae bacterium]|jgi:SNF2 family DNA or RNA helicase|nr:family helicase [Paenibacillaceae bacterium]
MNAKDAVIELNFLRRPGGFLLETDLSDVEKRYRELHLFSLKQQLFAWHKESFYGTLLELELPSIDGDGGIILPDALALGFFAEGIAQSAASVQPSPELSTYIEAAPLLLRCLREGRFAPDYGKWLDGKPGWRLVPEGQDAVEWTRLTDGSGKPNEELLSSWLDEVIKGVIERSTALQPVWEQLRENHPLLGTREAAGKEEASPSFMDEEDWLIAIGWRKDEAPFRVGLRLAEPGTWTETEVHGDWRLETVLINRDNPMDTVVWREGSGQQLQESWLPYLESRLAKERERWLRAAPELGDREARPLTGASVDTEENVAGLPDGTADGSEGLLSPDSLRRSLGDQEVWQFLTDGSIRLAEAGSTVLLPAWWEAVRKQKLRLKAKVRSSAGGSADSMFGMDAILQFDWRLSVGEANLSEEEFRRLAEQNRRLVQINGQWILLDPAMLEQIRAVMKRIQKKKGLSFREAMELYLLGGEDIGGVSQNDGGSQDEPDAESALRLEVELNDHLGRMVGHLQNTSSIPIVEDPEGFNGELRRYQREGVSWLTFLRQFGLGGCLADDMGLGKTVQWIVYLLHLKERGQLNAPALLICPTSVIGNWEKELERFAPGLRVHLHYGSQRSKGEHFPASVADVDVVITSYALSHMDEEELSGIEWSTLCLDEAQNIKNAHTKQAGAIRRLSALHRVALTGTPMENRLAELWSIFDYINPGYLGSLGEFRRTFASEVERGNEERTRQVQQLARPFLLRRLKKDPAIQLDLPDKNEMKSFVPLTLEQGAAYETILQDMFEKVDRLSPMERRGLILATITRLKQVCDHPLLLTKGNAGSTGNIVEAESKIVSQSSKLVRLLEMVEELRSEGDKCLIFTQFVEMGHLLQRVLEQERGETALFLHGGVPKAKRDKLIDSFQNEPDAGIFVLSLKAGGTGLNLTAANHVFHFDRWWNPAVENQATDRAFRIGQTRDVQVHKFISLGTLEERIDQMIDKKQGLSEQIVGSGEGWITELSTDELRELFTLRRQWMQD